MVVKQRSSNNGRQIEVAKQWSSNSGRQTELVTSVQLVSLGQLVRVDDA